ncbi:MAG: hypothetical protein N2555_05750 [Endomicrobia bacterium]|nr:hypothetical protein [Endomicrobiia bacterium]
MKNYFFLLVIFLLTLSTNYLFCKNNLIDVITLDNKNVVYGKLIRQTSNIVEVQISNVKEIYHLEYVSKIEYAGGRLVKIKLKDNTLIIAKPVELNKKILVLETEEKRLEIEREKIFQVEFLEEETKEISPKTKTGILRKISFGAIYAGLSSANITSWTEDESITDGGHSEIVQQVSTKPTLPFGLEFGIFFNQNIGLQIDVFSSGYSVESQNCKIKFSNLSQSIEENELLITLPQDKLVLEIIGASFSLLAKYSFKNIHPYLGLGFIVGNIKMKAATPFEDLIGRDIENYKYFSTTLGYSTQIGVIYGDFTKKRKLFLFAKVKYGQVFASYNFNVTGSLEAPYLGELTLTFLNYLIGIGYNF